MRYPEKGVSPSAPTLGRTIRPTPTSVGIRKQYHTTPSGAKTFKQGGITEKEYWHCRTCGFRVRRDLHAECPFCGTTNYWRPALRK